MNVEINKKNVRKMELVVCSAEGGLSARTLQRKSRRIFLAKKIAFAIFSGLHKLEGKGFAGK